MVISRELYMNKLISKRHNGLIKVVTGIRRCGKSYLLFNLFKDYLTNEGVADDHIIEIAFDYLKDSFLIDSAIRYDIKGKKYINTPSKYYFTDLGLRNARLNFRQVEETHAMENIIFNELKVRGYNVDVGVVVMNEVDKNGKKIRKQLEVDFVCNKGSKRFYIQSAYALPDKDKMEQEQRSLVNIGDGFKKIIITKDAVAPLYNEEGILVMSVYDFLLNPDSMDI
ncbi:MAG: DUF4143 domain-containing protein [Clostridiales bacterium]|nr:DUF4143 domain-containing protein [Clostridiales bacterium]